MTAIAAKLQCVVESLGRLLALDLEGPDVAETARGVAPAIMSLVATYKDCRYAIGEMRGMFADFAPFLAASRAKVEQALGHAKGEHATFMENLDASYDKSPLLNCAVAEGLLGESARFVGFAEALLGRIDRTRGAIPDYDAFFDARRRDLTRIGHELAAQFFDRLNTFYFAMRARTAECFVRASLADALCQMTGEERESGGRDIEALVRELKRAVDSLRLFCTGMGLPRPELDEERSAYEMSNGERAMAGVRADIAATRELEEKLADMTEAMAELHKYSSVCTKCRQYCASYVCPHCHVFLYCVLCKEGRRACPGCRTVFDEPLLINKTCFFGDEFDIERRRRRAAECEAGRPAD